MKHIIKLMFLLFVLGSSIAKAQVMMSGPTKVRMGATASYGAYSQCSTRFCWGTSSLGADPAGTRSNSSCSPEVLPTMVPPPSNCNCSQSMTVTFFTYFGNQVQNIRVFAEDGCGNLGTLQVQLIPALVNNIGASPVAQTINCGATGTAITTTTPAGGDGTYTYQWQSSPDTLNWTDVSGATSSSYTPSGLNTTTYFRVVVTSFDYTVTSNVTKVTVVTPAVSGGTISNTAQTINYNTTPTAISCSVATGGCSGLAYTYQWQSSPNGTTWTNITGATGQNYAPGNLTATTSYRRVATNNGVSANSTNVATITVYPQLTTSISPAAASVNYNGSPGLLTNTRAGGNGTYTYQWQSSPNNSTWTNITGVTTQNYTPLNLTATTYFRVITTSNTLSVTSNVATITVYPQLTTSISPASLSINYNTSPGVLTNTRAGGNGAYTYQWQSSPNNSTWTNITGVTTQNYTPLNLTATTYYRVITTSNTVSVTSNVATITVYPQLTTSISPASASVNYNGSPGVLTNTVSGGNGTYTYKWQRSADNSTWTDAGITTQNYTPVNLTATAYFRVITTSNSISVTSNTATIIVYPQLTTSISPTAVNVNYNGSPGLLANTRAGGNGTYTYQWQSSPNNSTWTNITGVTTQNYTPLNLTATTYYRVITTSNTVSVTSNVATITVYPQLTTSISPASASVNYNGSPGVLTNTVSGGNGTYIYKWQRSADNSTWTDAGITAQNYTPVNLTATTYYRVVTTSNGISVTSNTATITVYPQLVSSISPASANVNYNGSPGVLTNTVSGGNGTYTYKWQRSADNSTWTDAGITTQNYTPVNLTATTYYRVVTTSNGISVTSNAATITVYPQLVSSISPASANVNYNGSPGLLTNTVSGGNGTYTYKWQRSADNSTWTDAGITTQNYTPVNLTATTYYRVVTTSNGISVTSNAATITVYPQLTTSISPASANVNYNGSPGVLTNTVSGGNGTYTYKWQRSADNSTWTDAGITTQNYTPVNLTATTYYRVVTTSNGVSVTSNTATITVYPQLVSTISPASANVNYNGSPGVLTNTVSGGNGTYTYKWQSSADNSTWTDIGATTQNYTPVNLTAVTYYRVMTTSNGITVTSNTATIIVYPPLTCAVNPVSTVINYNTSPGQLSALADGGSGIYTYQWQVSTDNSSWGDIGGATSVSYTPGNLITTTYYRVIAGSNGATVTSGTATIIVNVQLVNSISPTSASINYNTSPGQLTSTRSGGNGSYTYQWQSSANNSTWSDITGATAQNYTPGNLTATTYYRVITTSNGQPVTSNTATITVFGKLVSTVSPGSIAIDYGTNTGQLTNTVSGGNGTYTYQWQTSVNNITWTDITGITTQHYTPPGALTATVYYRVVTTSNGVTVNSNAVMVIVRAPQAGSCTCTCLKPLFDYLIASHRLFTAATDNTVTAFLVQDATDAGYQISYTECSVLANNINKPFYALTTDVTGTLYKAQIGDCVVSLTSADGSNVSFYDLQNSSCDNNTTLYYNASSQLRARLQLESCATCTPVSSGICYSAVTDVSVNPYVTGLAGNWRLSKAYTYYGPRTAVPFDQETNIRENGVFSDFAPFWGIQANTVMAPQYDEKKWVWNSESTLFNPRGFELENKDPLGRYNAGLYGYDQALPTAVTQNSHYRESAYEGFEDYFFESQVCDASCAPGRNFDFSRYEQDLDTTQRHTGKYSLRVAAGGSDGINAPLVADDNDAFGLTFNAELSSCGDGNQVLKSIRANSDALLPVFSPISGKQVLVSAWIKEAQDCHCQAYTGSQVSIVVEQGSGNTITIAKPAGNIIEGWQRVEQVVDVPAGATRISINLQSTGGSIVYFDDVRIHPYNANMKSFVYNPVNLRLVAELDENNYATFYEYDDEGTLIRLKKETERGIKTIKETRNALLKEAQ